MPGVPIAIASTAQGEIPITAILTLAVRLTIIRLCDVEKAGTVH